MTERQELGSLEAMLFAHAEPVETARLADALRLDADEVTTLLKKLQKRYDEQESGMVILYFEPDRWQMTTRPYYGEMVKRILDTRRNAPLSPAALEVLAVIAYNQPVSRSFIEQVRGVDSSSTVTKLLDKGLIEEADGGTLFLDEIGNLPLHQQAKLLTVVQRRYVQRVGSNTPTTVDIRLVCATNKNLQKMVADGSFREDLLYRINTIQLELPPLRNRRDDIPLLAAMPNATARIYVASRRRLWRH